MIGKLVLLIVLMALLAVSVYLAYNFYLDNSSIVEQFKPVVINASEPSYESELLFFPDMRFNHNRISYKIGTECGIQKISDMEAAFDYIEKITDFSFYESFDETDIAVDCGEQFNKADLFIAGEGGPSSFVDTGKYNVILEGKIVLLYDNNDCGDKVALHELLHVFGFKHSDNKNSIMYNITSCKQVVTDDIINELNRLYSINSLPDLFLKDIVAFKHGRYLDINFTAKNQGLIDADNVRVELYSDSDEIDSFDLGKIEFGSGKIINAVNVRLSSRQVDKIDIYADKNNQIEELDEDNNKVELVLSQ